MPHLLIAGATGSGKSVCINVLLCSLLLRHDPSEVKLLLIDPKMLELNAYHDIPHLLHPVVTDPKEAYKALHWMTLEMERRYRELAKYGVRNIVGYNNKVRAGELPDAEAAEPLPYVVVIVDELADLMIIARNEVEDSIIRLAQMSRAVGMHLIIATQRPSVNVITGIEGGVWAVPRSGMVFRKDHGRLVLIAEMPYMVEMAGVITPEDLREQQDGEFEAIREHFEAAGIPVERAET